MTADNYVKLIRKILCEMARHTQVCVFQEGNLFLLQQQWLDMGTVTVEVDVIILVS